ncbi:MAG TPA: peptidoglycan bridge formation glycyltransferase FemA/FemB family protein [Tenuifilum sp.]|uniref:lipid II:glycine glycyltransferase FemX n=1 Tax=Tenuifilum sp. TaxID=2760880 RepID=UPI002D159DDB|nr:peptidoglycan bridge formation glycyltransferase FemA/FemB family protein [Tenuifilum sp.]
MIVTEIKEAYLKSLEEFIYNHPHGNFFQSPKAYNFYKSLPAFNPVLLISFDESGEINGSLLAVIQKEKGFIKSKFSRRCIVIGGPIVENGNEKVMDLLLQELVRIVKRSSVYIEFRNLFDLTKNKQVFEKNGFIFKEHLNFIIEIQGVNENFMKLDGNRRWQIKKSLKNNVEINILSSINEIQDFYLNLKELYQKKIKKPLPDFKFFETFFYNSNLGKYFLVKFEGKIIGGTMCPIYKNTIYEWYKFSLDKEYKNLYPGVVATWAAIEYGAKNGLSYFDFLGAGSPNSDYGVRDFKSKFGGELVNYGRFIKINNYFLFIIGILGLKIYKLVYGLLKKNRV